MTATVDPSSPPDRGHIFSTLVSEHSKALLAYTETLLNESKSLGVEVKDFRLGLEISVIQAFADRIVGMLKVRDPLSERVHLSPLELMGQSVAAIAGEMTRRAFGRRPVSKPAAGA